MEKRRNPARLYLIFVASIFVAAAVGILFNPHPMVMCGILLLLIIEFILIVVRINQLNKRARKAEMAKLAQPLTPQQRAQIPIVEKAILVEMLKAGGDVEMPTPKEEVFKEQLPTADVRQEADEALSKYT